MLSLEHQPLTLSQLSKRTTIPKSTLHGLLVDLTGAGLVHRLSDGGTYILGSRVLDLAHSYLDNDVLVKHFLDVAEEFVRNTSQTIHLGRLEGTDAMYLARREAPGAMQLASRVGTKFPASSSAVGKAILSLMTEDEIRSLYPGTELLPKLTPRSIGSVDELIRHIDVLRAGPGIAIDDEESQPGLRCYGAALFGLSGMYFGVSTTITATGHTRAEEDDLVRALLELRTQLLPASAGLDSDVVD